jgi:predicted permease
MRFAVLVTGNYFSVLGVNSVVGRTFAGDEGQVPGRDALVVLSHDFWRSEFSSDPHIIGRTVRINAIDFTVIGVAPEDFHSTDEYVRPYFYVPLSMEQRLQGLPKDPLADRSDHSLEVKARLKPGATREAAQGELDSLWKGLQPLHTEADGHRLPHVRTELQARIHSSPDDAFLVALLMALTGVVLMIACANVANLLLGRARARTREIAIRMSLGISRARLVRQLLTESLVLALLGTALGLAFAYAGIRFLQNIRVPTDVPVVISPQLDLRVLVFAVLLGILSALLFGLAPALQATKTSLVGALKSAEAQPTRKSMLGRNALVIAQLSMAMLLLLSTSMLLDGFRRTLRLSPGFRIDNLLTAQFDTSLVHYSSQQSHDFYRNLRDKVAELPGVHAVALGSVIPLSNQQRSEAVIPEGYSFPKGQTEAEILTSVVDENYFGVMNTGLLRGRAFTASDKQGAPLVAIVNQEFARRYWPNQDPIGKRMRVGNKDSSWVEVVGVAQTGTYTFVGEPPSPFLYLPLAQNERSTLALFMDTTADPASLGSALREAVHSLDPDQPVFNVRTMSELYRQRAGVTRMIMEIVGTMGMVGLSLALVGLYGVVAYSVARRTHEIGIRMAIGARRADVLRMVLQQGLRLSLFGIVIGGVISIATTRLLTAGLVGLAKPTLATYVAVPVSLLLVTLAACYLPAHRASRVEPMKALRYE